MKTSQLPVLILTVMSIMTACTKTNLNSTVDSSDSTAKDKLSRGPKKYIKPENFVSGITNKYFPLTPGDTFYYQTVSVDDGDSVFEENIIAVTADTKIIQGITCEVIHDAVFSDGILIEDTYDWYAQDIYGDVWYFGEDTKALQEDGTWSTEGSFESGVDGALAGIVMPGYPHHFIGQTYRQEYYVGHAEDKGTVLSTNETVTIGLGTFTHCVKTKETTPLEPGVIENKWYAPGVGQIKAVIEIGGDEHEELIGTN